ncbi:MAG: hypothetical protein BV457_02600 [Thermoplasmata archaeon M9B1D]|nr:MAG: hypothetical protein BV457_02600 [Thermoplasmata archaeon M9B1D]PNX51588.1 MAG: hypothetical protein BV456_02650 [Thermoplasmata archaeon M8B2D]
MRKILSLILATVFVLNAFSLIGNTLNIEPTKTDFKTDVNYVVCLNNLDQNAYKSITKQKVESDGLNRLPNIRTQSMQTYNYIIITTDDLINSITSSGFIDWKESIGFNIKIINITDSEITNQSGIDLAEQIRNFLRQYYTLWDINYVLIVGNYEKIPMRYCYPDPNNHRFDIFDYTAGEVPTDYYYADLSNSDAESWDLDGDKYYGEFGEDNPDFEPEVAVGRIPTNNAARITYTLEKTIAFEQDTNDWKKNALNAGAFFYFKNQNNQGLPAMDGAVLSYYIENDLMDGWTVSHYCEKEGLETSVYDWPALNEDSFISDWKNGQYSIVNWQGHGWTDRVAHCIWSTDDGDNIPEDSELSWPDFINKNSDLDDDYPSVVTAVSCYVGCPEIYSKSNLGIDLLTNPSIGAAVGVIASARSPYGSMTWTPSNPGGSDSIIYEFNKNMIINQERVGDALYNSKYYCNYYYGWDSYEEYIDVYTFNLYGDPSLVLQGVDVQGKPEKPIISGEISGKIRQDYTYYAITTDPNNDNIYYWFDWDDGTYSDWIGPNESGETCSATHSWSNQGSYQIKVRAKDAYGLISDWSDPLEVSMPRNKLITMGSMIFKILESYPIFYNLLKRII